MPKPFPAEFRRDVIAVARKGEASVAQVARDTWRWKRGRVAAVAAGIAGVFVGGYLLLLLHRQPERPHRTASQTMTT